MAIELDSVAIGPLSLKKHVVTGIVAGASLLLIYSVTVALLQGREHLLEQSGRLWYWLALLAVGFGVQVGLFSFIRQASHERRKAAGAGVATSGGVSAGAMVACCAHHLSDILPLLGLAALSAFLIKYQTFFLIAGVLFNALGITMMLETIQRQSLCPVVAGWKWNMGTVKKITAISVMLVLLLTGFRTLLGG